MNTDRLKEINLSLEICERLDKQYKKIIDKEYNKDIGFITTDKKVEGAYLYRAVNKKDIALIYLYLYYDKCICLKRKRDVFKELLRKI